MDICVERQWQESRTPAHRMAPSPQPSLNQRTDCPRTFTSTDGLNRREPRKLLISTTEMKGGWIRAGRGIKSCFYDRSSNSPRSGVLYVSGFRPRSILAQSLFESTQDRGYRARTRSRLGPWGATHCYAPMLTLRPAFHALPRFDCRRISAR